MQIKQMFEKKIDRPITGVIKVGQILEDNKEQELSEYVVTRELSKHFREFFGNYASSIHNQTDEMGVWISGFFGSGKSHFLKILSYILDNEEVDGKKAIEYFRGKEAISGDSMVMADMELACHTPTKAILFNVDSKASASAKSDSNAIVNVFNRVFNEKLGYDGANPALADLERDLDYAGRYQEFQDAYKSAIGKEWADDRSKFRIKRGKVVDVLVNMGFMDKVSAEIWAKESTSDNYKLASEDFAKRVAAYIEATGNRVVFLADEIGQFIANDSHLMLNLQTITEDLGTYCNGKAWVIVTAQEDIDSMVADIADRQNDFSKIQGRFKTRLSLSSVNADEVIRERILKKNSVGRETLEALYDSKEMQIQNVVDFKDATDQKKFTSAKEFAEIYPFLPYQFTLLSQVLNAIRLNSSSGKHLSEGERSMLGASQQAVISVMNKQDGALVPFYRFYDDLVKFLDHTHAIVISRAEENNVLNPNKEQDNFTVNVLKTLFLLKYVSNIPLTSGNIASLMVNDIGADRIALKLKVEESLRLLEKEQLITKSQDRYEFLTDEEQDIERAIRQRHISQGTVMDDILKEIQNSIYTVTRYRVAKYNGQYTFPFNFTVDKQQSSRNNAGNEICLHIITPRYEDGTDDTQMAILTGGAREVVLRLPKDSMIYYQEMLNFRQIKDYLRYVEDSKKGRSTVIRASKNEQADCSRDAAISQLRDAIGNADVFVNGGIPRGITTHDPVTKINEAMERLCSNVYMYLDYIEKPKTDQDIRSLFKGIVGKSALVLDDVASDNQKAKDEIYKYIVNNSDSHYSVSLRSLDEKYGKAPYGYNESDIHWMLASLFCDGRITPSFNKEILTLYNRTADELGSYFAGKKYIDQLLFKAKKPVSQVAVNAVKEVSKQLFQRTETTTDTDKLMANFKESASKRKNECQDILIECNATRGLPGKTALTQAITDLTAIETLKDSDSFYENVKNKKGDFLDLANDLLPVITFYKTSSSQKSIFIDKGLKALDLYDSSKEYITDADIKKTIESIRKIVEMPKPYEDIKRLPELYNAFSKKYVLILENIYKTISPAIEQDQGKVLSALEGKYYEDQFMDDVKKDFTNLKDRAKTENNIANLWGLKSKADSVCQIYLNKFNAMPAKQENGNDLIVPESPEKTVKTVMASLITSATWTITNENDLDQYITTFRRQIASLLNDADEVEIKF